MGTRMCLTTLHALGGSARGRLLSVFASSVLLLLVPVLVACTDLTGTPGAGVSSTSSEAAFTQAEGEIFLEPAGVAGPESFTGETFVPSGPTSTLNIPTTSTDSATTTTAGTQTTQAGAATTTAAGVQVTSVSGGAPALYGGSKSKSLVDKEGQLRFFEQNPAKAAAFCAALNSDPTFQWSGGNVIEPSDLRDYFDELTPLMLTRDTRVTNHGYRDGKPTARQSVLQAGQMVLVDRWGVPRVRCECGNPLAPPEPVKKTPKYTGPKWSNFNPVNIVVVQQTTVVIQTFVLVDITTGEVFVRPAGTEGTQDVADVADEGGAWNIEIELLSYDMENGRVSTVRWSGGFLIESSTMLDGAGDGSMQVDGFKCPECDVETGSWSADVSFTVLIGGEAVGSGDTQTLAVRTAVNDYNVGPISWETVDNQTAHNDGITAFLPNLLSEALFAFDVAADLSQPVVLGVSSGSFEGTATLTPYEP